METTAAALKQQPLNATQWISFYKLIDNLFGKISAAHLQSHFLPLHSTGCRFQMIKSFVVRLLFLENAGNEDGIE
jgi:hypothetical protein